jgi:hypothetical protein
MKPDRAARRLAPLLLVVASLLGGCGDDDDGAKPAREASTTTGPTTPTTAGGSVPQELQARWETTLDDGVTASLRLRAAEYQISRSGAVGSGTVAVEADVITFSTTRCTAGDGVYRWSLEEDSLTLTPMGEDLCPRSGVLAGRTFERTP